LRERGPQAATPPSSFQRDSPPRPRDAAGAAFTATHRSGIYTPRVIDLTPDPIFIRILGFPVYWYGIAYAVGLAVTYSVLLREARHRGLDENLLGTGMIVVAVAALIGGRLDLVIDQWQLYAPHPITAILPLTVQPDGSYAFAGFTGLGVPGGIILGTIAGALYVRRERQSFWRWADVVAPGLFVMQAIGRWGNFFNQELYGSPTSLPWGIAIQCGYRTQGYPCPPGTDPAATLGQHFQPMFLYESISGVLGALFLIYLSRRFANRLRPGDLLLVFFIWYGVVRFALETLKTNNWLFFGVPTAQVVAAITVVLALAILVARHSGRGPLRDTRRPTPVEPSETLPRPAPENG